jgi:hypothetical protein
MGVWNFRGRGKNVAARMRENENLRARCQTIGTESLRASVTTQQEARVKSRRLAQARGMICPDKGKHARVGENQEAREPGIRLIGISEKVERGQTSEKESSEETGVKRGAIEEKRSTR